jgi:hypothetical protein
MENLYLILPYYNYFNNIYREKNLKIFLKEYSNIKNLKIILIEGIFNNQNALEDYSNTLWKHIKYDVPQRIWIKENLINLAIKKHLPQRAKYICWLDADILFTNHDWVNQTIGLLKKYDIIQMFDRVLDLNKDTYDLSSKEDVIKSNYSYIYKLINQNDQNGHTGFGYAINRKFYKKINKLLDYNIIGSGDSIIGKSAGQSLSKEQIFKKHNLNAIYSLKYANELYEYYNKFKNVKISFLDSYIIHFWHGSWDSKKYVSRHKILQKYNFDSSFVDYNNDGIIYIKNMDLVKDIEDYLISREMQMNA